MHWIEFGFQIFVRLTCVTRCDGKCHAERVHCCQVSCSTFILSLAAILSQWLRFKLHAFHIQYYALKCWRAFYSLSWFEFPNRSIVNVWHVETLTQAKWWQKKYRHRNVIAALHVNKRERERAVVHRTHATGERIWCAARERMRVFMESKRMAHKTRSVLSCGRLFCSDLL